LETKWRHEKVYKGEGGAEEGSSSSMAKSEKIHTYIFGRAER
jgi:hypothetical protein